jgi:hypothetical protein
VVNAGSNVGCVPRTHRLKARSGDHALQNYNETKCAYKKYYNDTRQLVPTLGANVITILGTQALLAIGYVVASFMAN